MKSRIIVRVALFLLFLGGLVSYNLPLSPVRASITRYSQYIMEPLGLWQGWGFFLQPSVAAYAVRYSYTFADGTKQYEQLMDINAGFSKKIERMYAFNLIGDTKGTYSTIVLNNKCGNRQFGKVVTGVDIEVAAMTIPTVKGQPSIFTAEPVYQLQRHATCI